MSTASKVLERLVSTRLRLYLLGSTNLSQLQSAYRKGHCTETALLEVLNSVYTVADDKQVTVGWRGGLVVGRRTCDLRVVGSRPSRDAAAQQP